MDDNIQRKLQALRQDYTNALPQRINLLHTLWQALQQGWGSATLQAFHRDVHSLCGSAGTYGYSDISFRARQLEQALKQQDDKQPANALQRTHLQTLVDGLCDSIRESLMSQPAFDESPNQTVDNAVCVYVLETDSVLRADLLESLRYTGYQAWAIQDLATLEQAMNEKPAAAIILNTDFLRGEGMAQLHAIQAGQPEAAHLFFIVPGPELLPRLQAVRAEGHGFFQKPVDMFQLTQALNQKFSSAPVETCRVLIVDDSRALADYYSLILRQAGMITCVLNDPMQLLHELAQFQPNLILMDIYMPGCTGLELAAVLRYERRYMKLPIIFLSTEDDRRKQLSAMSLGGDDFLTKPVSPQHLVSAVRTRSKRAGMLDYFMTTDSLTGLLNHASVLGRLEMEIAHARQKKTPLSLIMIDIDHFKKINDGYGHPVGDLVLKRLSTLLLLRLRNQDVVGRYGGEEFLVILTGASAEQSHQVCDELRTQFAACEFTVKDGHFSTTFSAGFTVLSDDKDVNSLVSEADEALYCAKQGGRNRVVSFDTITRNA